MKIAASIDELKKYLKDLSECNFDKLNNVYFKQWVHREKVVRIAIMTVFVNEFIEKVCSLFDSL